MLKRIVTSISVIVILAFVKFGSFRKGSAINNMPGAGLSISSKLRILRYNKTPPEKMSS